MASKQFNVLWITTGSNRRLRANKTGNLTKFLKNQPYDVINKGDERRSGKENPLKRDG